MAEHHPEGVDYELPPCPKRITLYDDELTGKLFLVEEPEDHLSIRMLVLLAVSSFLSIFILGVFVGHLIS